MKSLVLSLLVLILSSCSMEGVMAPVAEKIHYEYKVNDTTITDNYHWLRDPNWPNVSDQKILDYLNAENSYTDGFFAKHKDLRESIFKELKGRIKLTDTSVYTKKQNYYYYSRTEEDKNYPIYCRKKIL